MSDEADNKPLTMPSLHEKTTQNIPKSKERSLWYRVPKSRVILKKHSRGVGNHNLIRLAAENSAKQKLSESRNLKNNDSEALVSQNPLEEAGDWLMFYTILIISRKKSRLQENSFDEISSLSR